MNIEKIINFVISDCIMILISSQKIQENTNYMCNDRPKNSLKILTQRNIFLTDPTSSEFDVIIFYWLIQFTIFKFSIQFWIYLTKLIYIYMQITFILIIFLDWWLGHTIKLLQRFFYIIVKTNFLFKSNSTKNSSY